MVLGRALKSAIRGAGVSPKTLSQYTRPDAIQNLQAKGQKKRTGPQGPLPPRLNDDNYASGAASKNEAIMAGTTKYTQNGEAMQIRNYAAPYGERTLKLSTRRTSGRGVTEEGSQRQIDISEQTDGIDDFEVGADPTKQRHHRAPLSMFRPFINGRSKEEKRIIFDHLRKLGVVTGNKKFNRADLSTNVHDDLHDWMRANGLEYAAKSLDAKFQFSGRPLEQLLPMLEDFVTYLQGAADEKMFELVQNEARRGR